MRETCPYPKPEWVEQKPRIERSTILDRKTNIKSLFYIKNKKEYLLTIIEKFITL